MSNHEVLVEGDELLGALALHDGTLYYLEADPAIPRSGSILRPVPRWNLVALDLASGASRSLLDRPIAAPHFVGADEGGVVLVGDTIQLVDPGTGAVRIVALDAQAGCGVGWSRRHVVFLHRRADVDDDVCALDRETGDLRRRLLPVTGNDLCALGADETWLVWALERAREVHVAPLADPAAVRSTSVSGRIRGLWLAAGRVLVQTDHVRTMRLDDLDAPTVHEGRARVHDVRAGGAGLFAALGGVTRGDERTAGGLARLTDTFEVVHSTVPTGEKAPMNVENTILGLAVDDRHVVFVERTHGRSRLLRLPADAPAVAVERRTVPPGPRPEIRRQQERRDALARIFGRADDLAPFVPVPMGVTLHDLEGPDDVWITATSGLSDPEYRPLMTHLAGPEQRADLGTQVSSVVVTAVGRAPCDYELYVRRRGRAGWAVELLLAVLRAGPIGATPAVVAIDGPVPAVLVHEGMAAAAPFRLLQVTPLTAAEARFGSDSPARPGELQALLAAAGALDLARTDRAPVVP